MGSRSLLISLVASWKVAATDGGEGTLNLPLPLAPYNLPLMQWSSSGLMDELAMFWLFSQSINQSIIKPSTAREAPWPILSNASTLTLRLRPLWLYIVCSSQTFWSLESFTLLSREPPWCRRGVSGSPRVHVQSDAGGGPLGYSWSP